jgi:hypothetical protein
MAWLASCLRDAARAPPLTAPIGAERARCETADRLCIVFRSEMSPEFETERLLVGLDHAVVSIARETWRAPIMSCTPGLLRVITRCSFCFK